MITSPRKSVPGTKQPGNTNANSEDLVLKLLKVELRMLDLPKVVLNAC